MVMRIQEHQGQLRMEITTQATLKLPLERPIHSCLVTKLKGHQMQAPLAMQTPVQTPLQMLALTLVQLEEVKDKSVQITPSLTVELKTEFLMDLDIT